MDLLSLVLTLRPRQEAALPPRLARAAHAILLNRVAEQDPVLAAALHADDGPRPFTCSNLMGARNNQVLLKETPYRLRYTALTTPVAANLTQAFAVGETLTFEGVDFTIAEVGSPLEPGTGQGTKDDGPTENPTSDNLWVAVDTYQELAARHLLPSGPPPDNRWAFLLAAPLGFRSQGLTQPLPLPGLFFGSLVRRWNAFAPVALPEAELQRYAEEMVAISRFALRSAPGWERGRGLRIGAIGKVTYRAMNRDPYWLAVLSLLAEFALYSGVGAMTTAGMGQVRRIMKGE
jgi:CRISPR-associated endoribonuclease Cas6